MALSSALPAERGTRIVGGIIVAASVSLSLFILYTAVRGEFTMMVQRGVPLGLALVLIFLMFPLGRSLAARLVDLLLVGASVGAVSYVVLNYQAISDRAGLSTTGDVLAGLVGTVVVLEACRRTTGIWLSAIALVLMAYALLGPLMPGALSHNGYELERILRYNWLGQEGIYGSVLGVVASVIGAYFVFSAFMDITGGGKAFANLAYLGTRRFRSGPAQAGIGAAAMYGTMSGSGVADVAAVGTFAIPLMTRAGFPPRFAAATQALASIGAQIMPPVMGSAAFLMAELTGTPYASIAAMAILPAVLYFATVSASAHLQALRQDLRIERLANASDTRRSILDSLPFLAPVVVLVWFLVGGYSPERAVFFATVTVVVIGVLNLNRGAGYKRMGMRDLVRGLENGARISLQLWAVAACVGITIGMITATGVGVKLSEWIITLAQGNLALVLVFTAIASILLGTGLPTAPCYLLLAVIVAPVLVKMGIPLLVAHFFILFFGVTSDLTPPTALAPFTAARIAGAPPWATSWLVCRLGLPIFAIPFMLVATPALLGGPLPAVLSAFVPALAGCVVISMSMVGYGLAPTAPIERVLLLAAGALLVSGVPVAVVLGILLAAGILFRQRRRGRSLASARGRQGEA